MSAKPAAVEGGALLWVMFARAARPAALVAVLAVVGVTIASGWSGLVGGAIGVLLVLVFFGVDLVVIALSRSWSPQVLTAAILGEYVIKIVVLAAFVWWLDTHTTVDLHALAITVVVTTVAWVIALTVVAFRARSFTIDPS
jgi:ATP synthase protein I